MKERGWCRAPVRGCVVLAMGLLWSHAAAAQPSMPPGAVDRGWGGRVRVNGVRMDIRLFEVRQPPIEVAGGVARQPGLDPWLLPLPDGVMLSGVRDGRPWLMQLRQSRPGVTQGVLAVGLDASVGTRALPAEWTPPGATLLLDLQTRDERGKVAHQLYAHAADTATFSRLLQARLTALGWRAGAGGGLMEWHRARRILQLVVVPREQGSGLLAVEIEADE
ncbi:hypothetical protein EGT29_07830 [Pigmentiphaga sp. H8]|uniref:hypothetical protein n=1 Tax=unclassified Pigmentiphaga TaxID=2626614 RepID=UPI000F5AA912|nr:hypothetical protein [Pigmentiphaga sp. H8]AZG07790.1 hypothetical protein EGT29_07830 [Pigmentiphaga sp. H8]